MPPRFPAPPADVVRVWLLRLDRPPVPTPALAAVLAPEESARAARFVFARDRDRYVAARGLLRHVVGDAIGVAPSRVRLAYGVNGRPELAGASGTARAPAFNASHSGDRLAIAVTPGPRALGVDVELLRDVPEMEGVAERVYEAGERARLAADAGAARLATFHRLWTRKEACMKATGAGFALAPHTFALDADLPAQRVALPPHACAPAGIVLTVRDVPAGDDCAGAVAMEGEGWALDVVEVG